MNSLSSFVQSLYGYGRTSTLGGLWGSRGLGGYGNTYSAGRLSGFQATARTNNPFNPTCPWPLINGMIQQKAGYVQQMQSAIPGPEGVGPTGGNDFGYAGGPFPGARSMNMGLMGRNFMKK